MIFPDAYHTSCFIQNVVTALNISIGDYTYCGNAVDPAGFEKNNVLFNSPEFGGYPITDKFCMIAQGTKFITGPANHRISSVTAYPFNVFGGLWTAIPRRTWTSSRTRSAPPSAATSGETLKPSRTAFGKNQTPDFCIAMPRAFRRAASLFT